MSSTPQQPYFPVATTEDAPRPPFQHAESDYSAVRKDSYYRQSIPGISPSSQNRKPGFFQRIFNLYYFVPIFTIVLQTFLMAFGWSFFAVTSKEPLALPVPAARWAREHFQTVLLISAIIATLFAFVSAAFYQRLLRWSLARFLSSQEVSLYAITTTSRMARGAAVRNFKRPMWTIMALILLIATALQTAAWTTLLSPKNIVIKSNITGYELDLMSPAFREHFTTLGLSGEDERFARGIPFAESSGNTATATNFNLPGVLNFNYFTYFNGTSGIMPVVIEPIDSRLNAAGSATIPVRVTVPDRNRTPREFPGRFTMTQQGYTANVTCRRATLSDTTTPRMIVRSGRDTVLSTPVSLAQLEVTCPGSATPIRSEPVLTSAGLDTVLGLSCSNVDAAANRTSWDLILTGLGTYSSLGTTICNVLPYVNLVKVEYTDNTQLFNSSFPNFINASQPWAGQDAPFLGTFGTQMFLRSLRVGQSPLSNAMGDDILSFFETIPNGSQKLEDILQSYIRGTLEFSITLLRTAFSQENNGLFPGGTSEIPPAMRKPMNGTFWGDTVGWHQESATSGGIFIAPTIVALFCIALIIATMTGKKGKEPVANHYFDPGDILHVITASGEGGISVDFPFYHEDPIEYATDVWVKLAPVRGPDAKPGFISFVKSSS